MPRSVDAGYYDAELIGWGISEAKSSGNPQVNLKFRLIEPKLYDEPLAEGENCELTWFGGMQTVASSEGGKPAIEWTVKTMLDCGFMKDNPLDLANEEFQPGTVMPCFPAGTIMSLTIEDNEYNGSESSKIKFINIKGQRGGIQTISKEQAASKTNADALRAVLMREKKAREVPGGATVPKPPI